MIHRYRLTSVVVHIRICYMYTKQIEDVHNIKLLYMGDSPVTCVAAREIFPDIWIVSTYLVCRISKPLCMLDRVSRQA